MTREKSRSSMRATEIRESIEISRFDAGSGAIMNTHTSEFALFLTTPNRGEPAARDLQ